MTEKMGYIYVLTTPSFPNYVKIGYADDVNERLKQLDRSECLPFAFRVYATYAVSSRLSDKKLHTLIDSLNSDLRSVETVDGVKRKREFYAMSPEEAFDLLRNIAEISGTVGKLKLIKPTAEQMKDANTAKEIENERQKNFSFEECHIPAGAIVAFKDNPEITCEVLNDRKVKYNGEVMSLTGLAKLLLRKDAGVAGPRYFTYNGKDLNDIRAEVESQSDKND